MRYCLCPASFYRAKQVVIIGDPKQLKHISILRETEDKKLLPKIKSLSCI